MRAATEGNLPPVMPQGNLVEIPGREVRQVSPGELMVESSPSRQRRPPCKTNKEMSDEAADAADLTYLLTWYRLNLCSRFKKILVSRGIGASYEVFPSRQLVVPDFFFFFFFAGSVFCNWATVGNTT